jgi:plastocyanin
MLVARALLGLCLLVAASVQAEQFSVVLDEDCSCFYPDSFTIRAGESVTFTVSCDTVCGRAHNVIADDGSFRCADGCDDTGGDGSPRSYWQFSRTFTHPGVVGYHDEVTGARGVIIVLSAPGAAVVEFHDSERDHYFITADPIEQAYVDSGAVGAWQRTGGTFKAGGPTMVCRFGGNLNANPFTLVPWGPNSHFYTADARECAAIKALFDPTTVSWRFEGYDFTTTAPEIGGCPDGLVPVYRAYNDGFARGEDSNHRITADRAAYEATVARGWIGEGIVMCAPR